MKIATFIIFISLFFSNLYSLDTYCDICNEKIISEYYIDAWVNKFHATHKENAYLLLDYLLRPEVSADFVNLTHYASPIPAANEFIEKEILDDPAIYPTPDIMKRLQLSEVMQPKYERMRTRAFTRYKIGYKKK